MTTLRPGISNSTIAAIAACMSRMRLLALWLKRSRCGQYLLADVLAQCVGGADINRDTQQFPRRLFQPDHHQQSRPRRASATPSVLTHLVEHSRKTCTEDLGAGDSCLGPAVVAAPPATGVAQWFRNRRYCLTRGPRMLHNGSVIGSIVRRDG
jgi:hypothetical protein